MATTVLAIQPQEILTDITSTPDTNRDNFSRGALEHDLIDRVVQGDHEAFADLLKPYERMIYALRLVDPGQ